MIIPESHIRGADQLLNSVPHRVEFTVCSNVNGLYTATLKVYNRKKVRTLIKVENVDGFKRALAMLLYQCFLRTGDENG